ncbi:MAG: radical SAM protein [Candidatus Promineifilaceae bacterium]
MHINALSQMPRLAYRHPLVAKTILTKSSRNLVHSVERSTLAGKSLPPRSVHLMVTDICNLRCHMCQYAYSESPEYQLNRHGHMAPEVLREIVRTVPGSPVFALSGGEPLLHPQIESLISEIKRRDLVCTLTTNGWLLEKKAESICDSDLDVLIISIDGPKNLHDTIRGKGSFTRAVDGIERVLSRNRRPIVCISTTISDLNFGQLEAVYDLADDLGVDAYNINHLWFQTDEMTAQQMSSPQATTKGRVLWQLNPFDIDPEVVYQSLQKIRAKNSHMLFNELPRLNGEETRIYYHNPGQLVKVNETRCAWLVMRIWPNGDVRLCRESVAGNVQNQPLNKIWNNDRYLKFRRVLAKRGTFPICNRCCHLFPRV